MKERRASGATHSFRLGKRAADIVDNINHPRSAGGKSRRVSQAIVWFFTTPVESKGVSAMPLAGTIGVPTAFELVERIEELEERVQWWVKRCDSLTKNPESEAKTPPWWHRFWPY